MCVWSRLELSHRPWWAERVVLESEMTFSLAGLLQPSSSVSGCARGEFANKPFVINTLISSKYQTHKTVLTRTLNLLGHNCEDLSSVGFRKCWGLNWAVVQGTGDKILGHYLLYQDTQVHLSGWAGKNACISLEGGILNPFVSGILITPGFLSFGNLFAKTLLFNCCIPEK